MFKKHPKGLLAASLTNMGERFGFYTMMAILVLFLQAKFGLNGKDAGLIYSVFYFSIYILAFVGGIIADKIRNYKGVILTGLLVMAAGYVILSIPTDITEATRTLYLVVTCTGLFVIAFGNGLFKGNLQALIGQMYDSDKKYESMRDSGFQWFYMFINVGAIFAPFTAIAVRNGWLRSHDLAYDANLPALCHHQIDGTLEATRVVGQGGLDKAQGVAEQVFALDPTSKFTEIVEKVNMVEAPVTDLTAFAHNYLETFNTGFHYAFMCAIGAMAISLVIYLINKKTFPNAEKKVAEVKEGAKEVMEMSVKEVKQRIYALLAVFGVVIFFWFSFHQNGLTLTMFARDYTDLSMINIDLGFTSIQGAEIFQSINPIFIVLLTPIIMGLFGWLRAKGKEPSTPKKIAIGMGIAALAYVVMAFFSKDLPLFGVIESSPLAEGSGGGRVSPFLLIGTYLILTIAELFISPLGISFVSKVAPPKYQGIMQGGWLGATAIGNQLLFIGAILYESIPLWMTWSVFIAACCLSMFTMLFMVRWLERITK